MIKRNISVLIIEDCSIIADAYKYILDSIVNTKFNICFAINCDQAVQHIQHKNNQLVLLDLQLPVSENERYLSKLQMLELVHHIPIQKQQLTQLTLTEYLQ